jgi:HTH-type transcriptional regulator, competence development regulator
MAFGPWIRAAREEAGIPLNDFARRISISPAYWSRIERGLEKAPKDQLIIRACEVLNLDTDRAFVEAQRLPPDVKDDLATALRVYREFRSTRGR